MKYINSISHKIIRSLVPSLFRNVIVFVLMPFLLISCVTTEQQVLEARRDISQTAIHSKDASNPNIANDLKTARVKTINTELTRHHWRLSSAIDSRGKPLNQLESIRSQVVLDFYNRPDINNLGFSVGCNGSGANYRLLNNNQEEVQANLNQSVTLKTDIAISTMMSCDKLNKAEALLKNLMSQSSQLSMTILEEDANLTHQLELQQITDDGSILVWQGRLTKEARYGDAETIFLEVAAETKFCSSGTLNGIPQTCLVVRDVFYDKNWLIQQKSAWRVMKQPIAGYFHDESLEQILRIKTYVDDPVDVKGKQTIYELEAVVMSAKVQPKPNNEQNRQQNSQEKSSLNDEDNKTQFDKLMVGDVGSKFEEIDKNTLKNISEGKE